MAGFMNQILAKSIQLANQVIKSTELASSFKEECYQLKSHTEKLAEVLSQLVSPKVNSICYQRPIRLIIGETEQLLQKVLSIVLKCQRRIFVIIPAAEFKQISFQFQNSLWDLITLLYIFVLPNGRKCEYEHALLSSSLSFSHSMLQMQPPTMLKILCQIISDQKLYENVDDYRVLHFIGRQQLDLIVNALEEEYGSPTPTTEKKPIRWVIWFLIANLYARSLEHQSFGPILLLLLSQNDERFRNMIINEEEVIPLLKLLHKGRIEDQETAAKILGTLAFDSESVEHLIDLGVCLEFTRVLKAGAMKVQAEVAWAVSRLATNYPKCQDVFAQYNVIHVLVNHLAFETIEDHVQNVVVINKASSVLAIVMARSHLNMSKAIDEYDEEKKNPSKTHHEQSREFEDPQTKSRMKTMAARALRHLAKGNSSICRCIIDSRALMCFAVLLEKGSQDVKYNSALALMEITAVAEQDAELKRSATLKPSSPTFQVVVDQLVKIIKTEKDSDLLISCIKTIGNLARTFRVTDTRIICLLVRYLARETEVSEEASNALIKFARSDNYLHVDHSKIIISTGVGKHLVQLVHSHYRAMQLSALLLLCYISLHVPEEDALVEANVLATLEWASKQAYVIQHETLSSLLPKAKGILLMQPSVN